MWRRRYKDRGIVYIIIAVLCLIIFFVGYNAVSKIGKQSAENKDSNLIDTNLDQAVEVFDSIENIEADPKIESVTSKRIKMNDFFLKVLFNSNTYMKLAYEKESGAKENTGLNISLLNELKEILSPRNYLRTQFPAIISLVNASSYTATTSSDNIYKGANKDDESSTDFYENNHTYNEVEDIIFVESPEEAEEGYVINNNRNLDFSDIKIPSSIEVNEKEPYIMIYHTHGTESYLPKKEGNFHTEDRQYNVLTVGDIIEQVLSERGHNVDHQDIYHDIPSYNQSYVNSLSTVQKSMNKNNNLKVVFDIHRDGIEENSGRNTQVKINDKTLATFSLVIGNDTPNKESVIKFAEYVKAVSDKMYPGLCKGIIIKPYGKFNQYVSDYYGLIEVGSNLNTIDEAKETARLIGEILDQVILGIKK